MKEKILIVEDEPNLLDSLSKELVNTYYVLKAINGDDGLNTALETKPDLILLDILLPHMSGEEFMVKLRADKWGKDAKVIVITNLEDANIADRLRKLGVTDYLIKSNISIEDLSGIISNRLHTKKGLVTG